MTNPRLARTTGAISMVTLLAAPYAPSQPAHIEPQVIAMPVATALLGAEFSSNLVSFAARGSGLSGIHYSAPRVVFDTPPRSAPAAKELAQMARLDQIAELRDGWAGPGSSAVLDVVVANARLALREFGAQSPEFGPRPDGSVTFEWTSSAAIFTASIEGDGRSMYLCADHGGDAYTEVEGDFDLDQFVNFVRAGQHA